MTPQAPVYTARMNGFSLREHDEGWSWRWMGTAAAWTVVNTSSRPVVATLALEMSAFHRPRRMEVRLDGSAVQTLAVEPSRRIYRLGPLTLLPGDHSRVPSPENPTWRDVIGNGDRRPLSFAIGRGPGRSE